MNKDQLLSLVRSGLKILAGLLAAHGLQDSAGLLNTPDVTAVCLLAVSLLWSHFTHDGPAPSGPRYPVIIAAGLVTCLMLGTGCVAMKENQQLWKTTIFGFQAKTPGTASGTAIVVQLGLARNEYISNPVRIGSNGVPVAAPFTSHVDANVGLFNQRAVENISTMPEGLPESSFALSTISTAYPLPAAAAAPDVTPTNAPPVATNVTAAVTTKLTAPRHP